MREDQRTRWVRRTAGIALVLLPGAALAQEKTNSYVGLEACAECHKSEKSGDQLGTWQKSKHAQAYNSLATPRADSIAKAKGIAGPAKGATECLECHTIRSKDEEDLKLGVQCEACHGPGSAYQKLAVMKDKQASIAAGMTRYEDKAAIERQCRTCHNERSPTVKEFNFEERWEKIRHAKPA